MKLNYHIFKYEMLFALANKSILLSTSFFIILILTVGIGFGQIGENSENTALAIIWIAIALSSLLSIKAMFQDDFEDGTLDLYMLSAASLETIIFLKAFTHWITTNLPIIILIPIICTPLGLTFKQSILISIVMFISTPALSFISTIGAISL